MRQNNRPVAPTTAWRLPLAACSRQPPLSQLPRTASAAGLAVLRCLALAGRREGLALRVDVDALVRAGLRGRESEEEHREAAPRRQKKKARPGQGVLPS